MIWINSAAVPSGRIDKSAAVTGRAGPVFYAPPPARAIGPALDLFRGGLFTRPRTGHHLQSLGFAERHTALRSTNSFTQTPAAATVGGGSVCSRGAPGAAGEHRAGSERHECGRGAVQPEIRRSETACSTISVPKNWASSHHLWPAAPMKSARQCPRIRVPLGQSFDRDA